MAEQCLDSGVAFCSAEYSLLIPCTGWDIIKDLEQLWRFLREDLNSELASRGRIVQIDPHRIAVIGQSGGGTPALYAVSQKLFQ